MSNDTITYVIAGTAAGVSVIAWAALVLVPAWGRSPTCGSASWRSS